MKIDDKFLCCEMSLFDINDPKVKNWESKWSMPCNWQYFDRIKMSESELSNLVYQMENMPYGGSDLIMKPALEEFTIRVCDPESSAETLICYKRSVFPKKEIKKDLGNDLKQITIPVIDAYVHLNNGGVRTDEVITLGKQILITKKRAVSMSFSGGVWASIHNPLLHEFGGNNEERVTFVRTVKLVYMAIQKAMRDRPTLFKQKTQLINKTPNVHTSSQKRMKKHRKVKTIRIIHVDPIEFGKLTRPNCESSYKITCPCWGVIGHLRHYKNGNEVWVKPYTKGKERKNPGSYSPKQYQIVQEGTR